MCFAFIFAHACIGYSGGIGGDRCGDCIVCALDCLIIGFAGETIGPNAIVTQIAPRSKTGADIGGLNMIQHIGMIVFISVAIVLLNMVGIWAVALFKIAMNLTVVAYLQINPRSLASEV